MKKLMFAGLLVFAFSALSAHAQGAPEYELDADLGLQLQIAVPGAGDYDLFDSGLGLELQFRNWLDDFWGYALAIGYAEWSADKNADSPGANLYDFNGSIDIIPLGASVILNAFEGEDISVTLEGGLRYLMIDSKVTALNSDHSPTTRYDVAIDDAVVLRIAADADYVLNEDFTLSAGLAYQLDINHGSLSTQEGPGRDNIMDAFLVDIALRMPL